MRLENLKRMLTHGQESMTTRQIADALHEAMKLISKFENIPTDEEIYEIFPHGESEDYVYDALQEGRREGYKQAIKDLLG